MNTPSSSRTSAFLVLLISLAFTPATTNANEGDPIAITSGPGGAVTIETMWNLSVSVSNWGVIANDKPRDLNKTGPVNHVLDRKENQRSPTWTHVDEAETPSPNALKAQVFGAAALVTVDGVKIFWVPKSLSVAEEARKQIAGCDVLIIDNSKDSNGALKLASAIKPKMVIMTTETAEAQTVKGDTVAVSSKMPKAEMKVLALIPKPIVLNEELAALMKRKEAACKASQKVFAPLSPKQMNFRPSNGSHTPRWNTEHMMGRELLFFSQIFHEKDPAISVVDLNPKQMPPDYKAKHADWTGMEEALQMERVSAFTRRFAYLLNDLPLERKAPGSGWTLKRLLLQMERHYNEHTANVKKKFELPDWPKE